MTIIRVPDWRIRRSDGWQRVNTVSIPGYTPDPLPTGAGPFASTSPWNTATPTDTVWYNYAPLGTLTTPELGARSGSTSRIWYPAETSVGVWHSTNADPLWTFNMPDYIFVPFNRNRSASTFTFHCPADMVPNTDSDHILCVVNDDTGDYVEIWQAEVNSGAKTVTNISGQPGWARGNLITGPGAGTTGGNNDGVRASNYSWIGGLITAQDLTEGTINHALAIALTFYTLEGNGSDFNWISPATAKDVGGAAGNILMGSKIGIPHTEIPPVGLSSMGLTLWNCLQTYGAYVGDYAGGPWPIFYPDLNSISDLTVFNPWFAYWDYGGVCDVDLINPYLRVANYQP